MIKNLIRLMVLIIIPACVLVNFSDVSAQVIETHQAIYVPWSGYWWPFNGCGLGSGKDYYGHPSPLEKYEQYVYGSYPRELSNWYRQNYCQEEFPAWYGHCGHWSFAALWENFEILPSSIDNYVFRVGDKKGLLTLLHNKEIAAWGNGSKPDEFHLWLLKYIKDEKRGFIIDMDKGEEVWQYPVYKYTMTSQRTGNTESVHVNVICADDDVLPDYIGTQNRYYNFYYTLFLNAGNDIIGGEWTGDSLVEHPDRMYATLVQKSDAPLLNAETVRKIAQSKDDDLEKGTSTVSLAPGSYNLILLDPDHYQFDPDAGSMFSIHLDLMEGGGTYVNAVLTDKNQQVILSQEITRGTPLDKTVLSENPPYLLKITKTNYQTPGIYTVLYDSFRKFSNTIPYIPKDGNWSGFAVTNFSKDILKKVELTTYTKSGQPIQTLLGPLNMNPMQKIMFLFNGLPYRKLQYSDIDSVRISSSTDSGRLNLISGRNGGVAEIVQGRYKGPHIVLPDTVMDLQADYYMFGRIINESASATGVTLTMYNAAGSILRTAAMDLGPRESYEFSPGQFPFNNMPNGGWIDIQSQNQDNSLSGFQHIVKNNSVEINFATLPDASNKIVPHIPYSGTWDTELVLINTSSQKANMVLHRVMAGIDTSDDIQFVLNPGQRVSKPLHNILETSAAYPYYRSILSISSDQTFTGYYAYKSFNYEDHVTIPLLDENDFAGALVLSHNTQGIGWGTGVSIFNPGASQINFDIIPYEGNGNVIPGLTKTMTLDPGEYTVINVAGLFSGYVSKITFIRFETKNPADIIGGFHLYYGSAKGMCGANLQPVNK